MKRITTWKITISRTIAKEVEVTAETQDEAEELALKKYGNDAIDTYPVKGNPQLSLRSVKKFEWDELDNLMVPHGMFNGNVLTDRILKDLLEENPNGKIPENVINDALASGAFWFRARTDKHGDVTALDPVKTMADAKSMGFKPYRIPAFPKKYASKRKSLVGNQNFTYEELYAAWKELMERIINRRKNDDLMYPYLLDLRAFPDDDAGSIECLADDIEGLFDQATEYPREISATFVSFYSNSFVYDEAFEEASFHIENGELD